MNTKKEEKREAINMLPICSHEKRNGEGRRRGKLTKFRSRGRGRREEEDGVLGFLGRLSISLCKKRIEEGGRRRRSSSS
ncbi:hypothetical protein AAC387_Pa08g1633 [Persea americana]